MKKVQKMFLTGAALVFLVMLTGCLTTVAVGRDRHIDPPDHRYHPDDRHDDRPGDHHDDPPHY